jgi:EAL domain-containing protein (putative c-di-GMP-specific phosphodiesterase class I)
MIGVHYVSFLSMRYLSAIRFHTSRLRFEALARWKHPALGRVPPDKFIPVAEECGLIHSIGNYIMEAACREAATWQTSAENPIQLAVNVSAVQFNSDHIVTEIAEILKRTGLAPRILQLELTESVMLGSSRTCAEKMAKLRALGITLAIDDFGTGYSSLSYLADLPVNAIKTDRSFLRGRICCCRGSSNALSGIWAARPELRDPSTTVVTI